MLIEFTVGNYRSFKAPQTLSMVAAPLKSKDKRVDANNVIKMDDQPDLLTSAAIYGANASGKSNLLEALRLMRHMVVSSHRETKPIGGIKTEPFRLNTTAVREPSHFEIVFIRDGSRYRYGLEVTRERVVAEWLYRATSTRESRLFERDGDNILVGSRFPEGRKLTAQTRPNALFLSVVAQFNGPIAQTILAWFANIGIEHGHTDPALFLFTAMRLQESDQAEAIRRLICRLDLGIGDLRVERRPQSETEFPEDMPEQLVDLLKEMIGTTEGGEQITVHTVHTIYNDEGRPIGEAEFDLERDESEGTQKLFAMAGPLLETLKGGELLVIDELDTRLHPTMTREIVRLFNDRETNPHGAQLIFNTQNTNLLDNELFRRDQIWFVEKDSYGASRLYSLAEFKGVRNDLSFERGYIEGRFGAIPYLNPNKLRALLTEQNGEGG